MLLELNRLYQSITQRKAELLTSLDSLTDAQRSHAPSPSEWSPLQVLEHLVSVEESLAGPTAPALPADAKVLPKGRMFITFGGGLMRLCAQSGLRIPSLPVFEPQGNGDYPFLKTRWNTTRAALLPTIAAVMEATQAAPIALHPIAGPLNAAPVLILLDAHLAYHWRHLPRVKA